MPGNRQLKRMRTVKLVKRRQIARTDTRTRLWSGNSPPIYWTQVANVYILQMIKINILRNGLTASLVGHSDNFNHSFVIGYASLYIIMLSIKLLQHLLKIVFAALIRNYYANAKRLNNRRRLHLFFTVAKLKPAELFIWLNSRN